MQANINIKKKEIIEHLEKFKKENYPELSNSAFFVRCAIEVMKRKTSNERCEHGGFE